MRRFTGAPRAGLMATLGVIIYTACPLVGGADETAAPEAAAKEATTPADPPVVDTGWAVSSDEPDAAADSPKNRKTPRLAAKPSGPLKWVPAGVAKGAKTSEGGKELADPEPKPATPTKPKTKSKAAPKPSKTAENDPAAPPLVKQPSEAPGVEKDRVEKNDADEQSVPQEPKPFTGVIEVEPEPLAGDEAPSEADKPTDKEPSATDRSTESTPKPAPPQAKAAPLRPLTRYQRSLRSRLRSVLSYYYRRPLNSVDHDPWEVMHHMLAYGQHSRILDGGPRSRPMTAVGFLSYNMAAQQKQMMYLTADGVIETRVAVGMQGHKGQFLAMLAQCGISRHYPMRVDGARLTIEDLIRSEQLSCYAGEELTFKLIGLAHYLDLDATWVNDQGETWSFPRLIQEERNQKIRGAACGGTHRLSGLSLAVRKRRESGKPIDGEYAQAQRFVQQYVNYALSWQNRDGSLSTEWFRGPGSEEDIDRRARTTGHLLEWLLYTLPDEQLTSPATVRAVNYLTGLLATNTNNPWEIGPLSHALHALVLYDKRVFQPHDAGLIAAAQKSGRPSASPENLNYRQINSRVVASLPSADDADAARAELKNSKGNGLRGLFGNRRRPTHRSR